MGVPKLLWIPFTAHYTGMWGAPQRPGGYRAVQPVPSVTCLYVTRGPVPCTPVYPRAPRWPGPLWLKGWRAHDARAHTQMRGGRGADLLLQIGVRGRLQTVQLREHLVVLLEGVRPQRRDVGLLGKGLRLRCARNGARDTHGGGTRGAGHASRNTNGTAEVKREAFHTSIAQRSGGGGGTLLGSLLGHHTTHCTK